MLQAQQIWHVTASGNGSMDGSSWADASPDLAKTLQTAAAQDTVWVAAGIYTGGFLMKDGVQVYGGFSGDETALSERKLPGSGQNLTVLDGNFHFRVLTQPEAFSYVTVWDGFVICNGTATDGGGVYIRTNGIVRRSIIRNNVSGVPATGDYLANQGGVVFRTDSENKQAYVVAADNYGANYRLGVAGSAPKNTLFTALQDMNGEANTTALAQGRAVQALKKYRAESPAQNFTDWYLPSAGEWALFITDGEQNKNTLVLDRVDDALLRNNKTPLSGQKFWSSTVAQQNEMSSAWYINFNTGNLNAVNIWQYCKVRGIRKFNYTTEAGKGGAVYATSGSKIEGCLIYDNMSALGYAVCARGNVEITNSTVVGNSSETNSVNSFAVDGNSSVKLLNSIVTGNLDVSNAPSNYDSRIAHQYSAIETTLALPDGNIRLEQMNEADGAKFVNPSGKDYRLQSSSICVLAANTSLVPAGLDTDLVGNSRIGDKGVSMGAYEPSTASGVEPVQQLLAVSIYPNPAPRASSFVVELGASVDTDAHIIELFNASGQKLSAYKARQSNKILSPSASGIYILRIKGKELNREFKIITE
jgi:hypothetical protein